MNENVFNEAQMHTAQIKCKNVRNSKNSATK